MKTWILLSLSSLFFTVSAEAAPSSVGRKKALPAEELFRRYKPAVVKIVIRQQRIPIATGSGLFVSADGKLITNNHVIKNALRSGSFTVEFVLADGSVIRDFLISQCRDHRGMDLCLLKLPVKPKNYFRVTDYKPSPGESVYVIGHPQDLDFSITNGIVSALRESPTKVRELQITAAISPGNSGGPIFNSRGTLVGVASKFYKDGQNLNFGILSSEVARYIETNTRFVSLSRHRKNYDTKIRQFVDRWVTKEIDPAYESARQGHPISDTSGFKDVTFSFSGDRVKIPLPKLFDSCRKVETKRGAKAYQCVGLNETVIFSLSRTPAEPDAPLHRLDGRKLVRAKPLPIVDLLMQDGRWSEYEKLHSPENRKYLFSVPSEAKCRKISENTLPDAAFTSGSALCRFSIYNDLEPDAYSYSVWVQKGSFVYDFYIWMEDAGYAKYLNNVPTLAVLGARSESDDLDSKSGDNRALANGTISIQPTDFSIELVPGYTLANSESLGNGTKTYMYSRQRPDPAANSAMSIFMVNIFKTTLSSRDLDWKAKRLFQETMNGFGANIDMESWRKEPLRTDSMPGILQTAQGRRKNTDLSVFHATLVGEKATYMIFAFCDAHDAAKSLLEFQRMASSFKQK